MAEQESVFNFGLAYLERLSKIIEYCQMAAINQNILGWLNGLRAMEREVYIKYNKDDNEKIEAQFKEINELCANPQNLIIEKQNILMKLHKLDKSFRMIIKPILDPTKSDPTKAVIQT